MESGWSVYILEKSEINPLDLYRVRSEDITVTEDLKEGDVAVKGCSLVLVVYGRNGMEIALTDIDVAFDFARHFEKAGTRNRETNQTEHAISSLDYTYMLF